MVQWLPQRAIHDDPNAYFHQPIQKSIRIHFQLVLRGLIWKDPVAGANMLSF